MTLSLPPLCTVLVWALTVLALPAMASSVAIVTDLSGKATAEGMNVAILFEIREDARVEVTDGTRMVAVYFSSGEEYTFTGPAQIHFRPGEPQVLSGPKAEKRSNPLARSGRNVAIKPIGVAQAGFVMRSWRNTARVKLLSPSGTLTLEHSPEFRWTEVESALRYHFELTDDTGEPLYEANVAASSLRLPASLRLREGARYTWQVSTRLSNGRRYVGASDFSVASPELRSEAEALRPVATAPVSAQVTFALWLEQMELKDEARKYWKAVASERPRDERLKTLSVD
ncbi:MAG TPA: hypothetical protein VFC18_09425 [Burkholderiales bacterium]|nr:hypothetical protein [Burkholderiales bacterium]